MKFVTNMEPSKPHIHVKNDLAKANELNDFYLRFETQGFSEFIVDSFVYDVGTSVRVLSLQSSVIHGFVTEP